MPGRRHPRSRSPYPRHAALTDANHTSRSGDRPHPTGPHERLGDKGSSARQASTLGCHSRGVCRLINRRCEWGRIGRRSPSSRRGGSAQRACARRRCRTAADRCDAVARGSARGRPRRPRRRNHRSTRLARSAGFRESLDRHRELLEKIEVLLRGAAQRREVVADNHRVDPTEHALPRTVIAER
jgi:hypothetical protein